MESEKTYIENLLAENNKLKQENNTLKRLLAIYLFRHGFLNDSEINFNLIDLELNDLNLESKFSEIAKSKKQSSASGYDVLSNLFSKSSTDETKVPNELIDYKAIVEHSTDAIYCNNISGEYIYVNSFFASLFKLPPEEFIGKRISDFYSDENAEIRESAIKKVFSTGKSCNYEAELKNHERHQFFYSTTSPVKDENGTVIFTVTISKDITERKQLEEVAFNKKKFWESLITISPDIIYIVDIIEQKALFVNNGVEKILGYTPEEIDSFGSNLYAELMHPEDYQTFLTNGIKAYSEMDDNQNQVNQFRLRKKNGDWLWFQSNEIIYQRNLDGSPKSVFGIMQDITEVKNSLTLIQEKKDELEALNTEKIKYFSILAHDLRSPFQGFLTLTQILADNAIDLTPQELTTLGGNMNNAAKNLFARLKNLLDWTKTQNGSISFYPEVISLVDIVLENIILCKNDCEQKSIKIEFHPHKPYMIEGDEKMLNSIFSNIITNSIKFTPKNGLIQIEIIEKDEQTLLVQIKDNGIGMEESLVAKLFKFGEKTNRKGTDGELSTGLGLMLCKEFILRHKGNIWVESVENQGTTVSFTLNKN